jgi:hypothetical protein
MVVLGSKNITFNLHGILQMIGSLITYVIVVFQARDDKVSDASYAHQIDLNRSTWEIIDAINNKSIRTN